VISSVDGFNASGELVFSVFGERKPGKPELDGWRKLVDSLRSR
jgi:putative hemin transport protein